MSPSLSLLLLPTCPLTPPNFPSAGFRGALQCLGRLGEDLDFTCAPDRLSVSVVNSSRTAFGIVHFYPRFFQRYHLDLPGEADDERSSSSPANAKFRFSVTAKVCPK